MDLGPSIGPGRGPNLARVVRPPVGFGWSPSFKIIQRAPGSFTTTLDTETLKATTSITRYVNIARADNSGNGLSAAAADKSIWAGLNAMSGATTYYILGSADPSSPTMYNADHNWQSALLHDCNIIVVSDFTTLAPGYAISSVGAPEGGGHLGTWGLGPTEAAVYEATMAASPYDVIDATVLTAAGVPSSLTLQTSTAAVQANPGSWYWAAGVLYVRTADSRDPDSNLRPLRSATNGHSSLAVNLYVQGLTFEGGSQRAFYLQNCGTATFVDCVFRNGKQGLELNTGAGVTNATKTVYCIRCKGLGNQADGLGGTANGSGITLNWFEWDCESTGNSGAGTDQGSSLHFTAGNTAVNCIRVGGTYHGNKTGGVADVGGCDVWMPGARVYGEVTGVYCGDTGTTWLHDCVLTGCTTDLVTDNAGGTIYVSGTTYTTTSGVGTEGTAYHP